LNFDLVWMLKVIPAAIIGLTFHEFSHAFIAYKLGDDTAKNAGRLTLNPIKHIDPFGFLLIIIAGFGWAKPVTVNPENLKNKNRDEIFISLAGPISNFILGLIFLVIARLMYIFPFFNSTQGGIDVVNISVLWGVINFGLFIFNLIPIPPLDGSHVYLTYFKEINQNVTQNIYRIGTWILLGILIIQSRTDIEILPVSKIVNGITKVVINVLGF
jgi:Zn-dependent protease